MKRPIKNDPRLYTTNLFGEERKSYAWAYRKTIEDMRRYDTGMHWVISYSGGKDSTTVTTLVAHAIESGEIPAPRSLIVMYADTGMEVPPLRAAALETLHILEEAGVKTHVVRPELDKRFFVYMLGRGVPPPHSTMRWCTGKLKIEPMNRIMRAAYEQVGERFLLLTGVRQGESAVRDERLVIACSKDGAECGQGRLYIDKTAKSLADTVVPILHWRICHVWDWLMWEAPKRFAKATSIVAEIYGGDEARENHARTGCMMCPLVSEDYMMEYVCSLPFYVYLAPVRRLRSLYEWMRRPENRLRRQARHNDYPLGPLTMTARRKALADVLAIQDEANEAARRLGRPEISLINQEEQVRILELIESNTWPNRWTGEEMMGDTLFARNGVIPIALPIYAKSLEESEAQE